MTTTLFKRSNSVYWLSVSAYSVLAESIYSAQLAIILAFFRPVRDIFPADVAKGISTLTLFRKVGLGFSTGLVAFLAAVPIFLRTDRASILASFLVNHFYSGSNAVLVIVLVLLLPVLSEMFFRGLLFRVLLQNMSAAASTMVSALLFTLYFPALNWIALSILGLLNSFLFYRTRSVLACIVANSFFMLGVIVFLIWRSP